MAARDRCATSVATFGATAQPGHFGGGTGLVDEDQIGGVEIRLHLEPGLAPLGDVGPLLLAGVRGF